MSINWWFTALIHIGEQIHIFCFLHVMVSCVSDSMLYWCPFRLWARGGMLYNEGQFWSMKMLPHFSWWFLKKQCNFLLTFSTVSRFLVWKLWPHSVAIKIRLLDDVLSNILLYPLKCSVTNLFCGTFSMNMTKTEFHSTCSVILLEVNLVVFHLNQVLFA